MTFTLSAIARLRLHNQWITAPIRGDAANVVDHLMAAQSQDFAGAKWSLGLRMRGATELQVERAFNEGRILRTHVLRPTWHFVTPRDIRWLLKLTAPRVLLRSALPYRNAGVTAAMFRKAETVMQRALGKSTFLTRAELSQRLEAAGLETRGAFRLAAILEHAELQGLICSGPLHGKRMTYALLDHRAPALMKFDRNAALEELARRFFTSRGPATVHDLAKWATLTLADCRGALEAVRGGLEKETIEKQEYWFSGASAPRLASPAAHLLSVYDEYLSSYRGHTVIAPVEISQRLRALGLALSGVIFIDGMAVGTWKRSMAKDAAHIKLDPFRKLTAAERDAIHLAAEQYAKFHGVRAKVS